MDKFDVPKIVNRHVLKAIYELNGQGLKHPRILDVCELVAYTMRNNVPVSNLQDVVRQSLENMIKLGVIEKKNIKFMRIPKKTSLPHPSIPKRIDDEKVFVRKTQKKEKTPLDPNKKRKPDLSPDSMSGNEIEKSTKRLRTSRPMTRKGLKVHLPKKRTHFSNNELQELEDVEYHDHSNGVSDSENETDYSVSADDEQNPKSSSESFSFYNPPKDYKNSTENDISQQLKKEVRENSPETRAAETQTEKPVESKETLDVTKKTSNEAVEEQTTSNEDLNEEKQNLKPSPNTSQEKLATSNKDTKEEMEDIYT